MNKFYTAVLKRLFDLVFSLILIVTLSPGILIVSLILFVNNRGKVFFFQIRPGLKEKPFYIWKFKTMTDQKDLNGDLLPDDERITRIGRIIRDFSIDEILQLINVIKGDMSFVGPRPLLMKYLDLYSNEQASRHLVKPGITGLAQINGRNNLSWEDKFKFDITYVNNISMLLDLKILFLTIKKVLYRNGINQKNGVTMTEFKGNNSE